MTPHGTAGITGYAVGSARSIASVPVDTTGVVTASAVAAGAP